MSDFEIQKQECKDNLLEMYEDTLIKANNGSEILTKDFIDEYIDIIAEWVESIIDLSVASVNPIVYTKNGITVLKYADGRMEQYGYIRDGSSTVSKQTVVLLNEPYIKKDYNVSVVYAGSGAGVFSSVYDFNNNNKASVEKFTVLSSVASGTAVSIDFMWSTKGFWK